MDDKSCINNYMMNKVDGFEYILQAFIDLFNSKMRKK